MVMSLDKYTSCTALRILIPSGVGFLNAFLPNISPVPPERLLMTAAFTASAKSFPH